jgi:[acyl-carrier-protein] S-malonyltransferase
VNEDGNFTVGGSHAALLAVSQEAEARGAKRAFVLPVAVPSHTPLLREATEQFRAVLHEASPRLPGAGYRLLSGIDGNTVGDIETGIDKLARQTSTTIDLAACLESCRSAGAVAALELGPGATLSHMASALFPDGRTRSVEEFRSLAGLRNWLQRAVAFDTAP